MKPKAEELPSRAAPKLRATERRHNRSRRKRGPEKRGQLTPGYETLKVDKSNALKCSRCGADINRATRLCDSTFRPCTVAVGRIRSALRKFPPLPKPAIRTPLVGRNEPRF